MPHITVAMSRSTRRGVKDIVFGSLLRRNSVVESVAGVKNTFSSWDSCMAQTYCKWPVIAGIIIGSLIIFSILWCCVRCCCCGMSCCCTCFNFLKCCDCCGGLCDGKKGKPMKHLDDPYSHHGASAGYHAPAPMMAGGFGKPPPPQYAQFEVGSNGLAVEPKPLNEDALPPMPSWDGAAKKHVETEEERNAVELGELDPATGQKVPLMAGALAHGNSTPTSPMHEVGASPYGARPGQGGGNGYMGVAAGDPHGQNNNGMYGASPAREVDASPFGVRPIQGGAYGQPGVAGVDPYSRNAGGAYGAPPAGRGYGSPSPQEDRGYNAGFERSMPQRQNTGDRGQFPPQMSRQQTGNSRIPYDRQYTDQSNGFNSRNPPNDQYNMQPIAPPADNFNQPPRGPSRGGQRIASPPINNDAGFNYNAQEYPRSRPTPPPQQSYNSGRRPSPPRNGGYDGSNVPVSSPPQQYSAYEAYQPPEPASNHHRAPTALRPGTGRDRREPQGWDPVAH